MNIIELRLNLRYKSSINKTKLSMSPTHSRSLKQLSKKSILYWRIAQTGVWLVGLTIIFFLLFYPTIGIHLFWNVLIPIAPALIVVAIGLWRNVCPMATNSLFFRHLGLSKKKKLTMKQSSILNFIAIASLFIIVPLRHGIFDMNGPATAVLILSLAVAAIGMGLIYEWKSGWCSGLCPVHPVEKLYGLNSKLYLPNAHCDSCSRCMVLCPDATPRVNPMSLKKNNFHKISGFLMVAAFPGFIWGWFQVPDAERIIDLEHLISLYYLPLIGMAVTSLLYLFLKRFFKQKLLTAIFSASAVSCYYWYRIPALVGFGIFPKDGMLVDLSRSIPQWSVDLVVATITLFLFWRIVFREQTDAPWAKRPTYEDKLKAA